MSDMQEQLASVRKKLQFSEQRNSAQVLPQDNQRDIVLQVRQTDDTYSTPKCCNPDGTNAWYKTLSFHVSSTVKQKDILVSLPSNRYFFDSTTCQRITGRVTLPRVSRQKDLKRDYIVRNTLVEIDSAVIKDSTKFRKPGDISIPKGSYIYISQLFLYRGESVVEIGTNPFVPRLRKIHDLPAFYQPLEQAYRRYLMNNPSPSGIGYMVRKEASFMRYYRA